MNGSNSIQDGKSQVLAAVDIVELIGRTVVLKRRGRDFVGLCPFHQEKTPSFHVHPGKQYYYCFGCKKHGNVIDFVMERDRIQFMEALKLLADQAGVELPRGGGTREKKGERELILEMQSAACAFFEKQLADAQVGVAAREYLKKRSINEESIRRFRIGLAPPGWDGLRSGELGRKFTPQQLAMGGLVKPNTRGDGYYDTFRNRLIFPIRDDLGRIIAFGGRVLPGGDDPAKYLNSPETPVFSKSRCIFGLDLAKNRIVETRTVAVVEGYTDVVMAHQFGLANVVSVLGTALTEQHVGILKRYADRIVLLFDPDMAGDSAANRAIELLLRQPVEIHVASLPDDMDPDEYILKHGAEAFDRILKEAPDALSHQWTLLSRKFQESDGVTGRQKAAEVYLQQLADARDASGLGPIDTIRWGAVVTRLSRLLGLPNDEINRRFKFRKQSRKGPRIQAEGRELPTEEFSKAAADAGAGVGPLTARDRAERAILGILLVEPGRWFSIQQDLQAGDFKNSDCMELARVYWDHQRYEGEPVFSAFLGELDEAKLGTLAIELAREVEALEDIESALAEAMEHLRREKSRLEEREYLAALCRTKEEKVSSEEEIARLKAYISNVQPDMRRLGPMRGA